MVQFKIGDLVMCHLDRDNDTQFRFDKNKPLEIIGGDELSEYHLVQEGLWHQFRRTSEGRHHLSVLPHRLSLVKRGDNQSSIIAKIKYLDKRFTERKQVCLTR